jgi:ABC-type transport system involved in Fe-S cluster assembly fused permease/ATPase subunit
MMSLTAAGMLLFWVALSTWRIYFRRPAAKAEPQGV